MGNPLPAPAPAKPARLHSLDAYRGFIMLAMASSGFAFATIAKQLESSKRLTETLPEWLWPFDAPTSFLPEGIWNTLAYQFDHVAWVGCGFWDLIQPSFMFMVGVAIPYSYASRRAKGDSNLNIFAHVLLRSFILVLLGIFLSSNWSTHTEWTFVNVLTQIGLGYTFVFLLRGRGVVVQLLALAVILGGYWYAFYQHPRPPSDFDYHAVGLPRDTEPLTGLAAHWNINTNFASDVDKRFLNVFHTLDESVFHGKMRYPAFEFNKGGYATLNFIPSMATMILGLMAGELLRGSRSPRGKFLLLVLAGGVCLVLGLVAGETVCPIVKRIWTPSWTLFSAGWTFFILAAFYWVIDLQGYQRWAFPLAIVGMNSIAVYCMSQLLKPWIRKTIQIHISPDLFANPLYGKFFECLAMLAVLWLVCLWLYRQKIFIRI